MATENWHIERVADTIANIRSNMDAYQSGICTDDALTGIRHVCANATPDYIYGAAMARKTAVAGGAVTYLPEQFGALTAASLKIEDLTASQPIVTDASKILVSSSYAGLLGSLMGSMSLTQGYLPYAATATTFANSPISTDGTKVGIGTAISSNLLHLLGTSTQLRIGYDVNNYATLGVSSAGNLTITPTGATTYIAGNLTLNTDAVFTLISNSSVLKLNLDDTMSRGLWINTDSAGEVGGVLLTDGTGKPGRLCLARIESGITGIDTDELLGVLAFSGGDVVSVNGVVDGAKIEGVADGDWATNSFPSRLEFYTNAGASSSTLRMTIDNAGNVAIANGLYTQGFEDGTNATLKDFLTLNRTFSGAVKATTNDGVGLSGTLECACDTFEIGRINFWKEGSGGTAESSMSFFTGYDVGAAREALRLDSAKKLWAYGDATIAGNIKKGGHFSSFVSMPADINNGATLDVLFTAPAAGSAGWIRIVWAGTVNGTNTKQNSVEHTGSYFLAANNLTDNNIALVKKDGGETITLAVDANHSGNKIKITLSNGSGYTLYYQVLMVEFLDVSGYWTEG